MYLKAEGVSPLTRDMFNALLRERVLKEDYDKLIQQLADRKDVESDIEIHTFIAKHNLDALIDCVGFMGVLADIDYVLNNPHVSLNSGAKVLDIGSNNGLKTVYFGLERECDLVGVEPVWKLFNQSVRRRDRYMGRFRGRVDFRNCRFDEVRGEHDVILGLRFFRESAYTDERFVGESLEKMYGSSNQGGHTVLTISINNSGDLEMYHAAIRDSRFGVESIVHHEIRQYEIPVTERKGIDARLFCVTLVKVE